MPLLKLVDGSEKPIVGAEIDRVARQILHDGFACIENYFRPDEIAEARQQAIDIVRAKNGEYTTVDGADDLRGEVLHNHFGRERTLELCRSICKRQGIELESQVRSKQVLRCLAGQSGRRHSYYFHFDSYHLTVLVPIDLPRSPESGDLLMFPNRRRHRRRYLTNMIEKLYYECNVAQRRMKRLALQGKDAIRLEMTPGNIYLFNGDRTLHANEPCDAAKLRATLLFHFAEIYQGHWLRRLRRQ